MNTEKSRPESTGVAEHYAEMWQRAWEPYLRLFRESAPPNISLPDFGKLQQRYIEFASSEGAAAYRKFSQLGADYYTALFNTGMNLSEEFYRQVYQTKAAPPVSVPRSAAPVRELVFTGRIGSTASRSFIVSNRTNQPARVSFELSEFVKENGSDKLRLDAQIIPSSFDLAGQAERTIDCSLPLTEALEAGCEYRAFLRVIGFPDMEIGLMVKAESAPPTKAKPHVATTRRRKKRKA
jgi:hypothetical protein